MCERVSTCVGFNFFHLNAAQFTDLFYAIKVPAVNGNR